MKTYLNMVIAAASLSTIGIFVNLIGDNVHFMTIVFYRFFFGLLFLLMVVPFIDRRVFHITKRDAEQYFLVGLLSVITISLFTIAFKFAPVQNVVLLNYTSPFFVLVLGYWFLKEKLTRTKMVTMLIAMIGIFIINPFNMGPYRIGNLLAILAAVFAAAHLISMRKIDMDHSIGDVLWFFLFGTLILLPVPFIFGWGDISGVVHHIIGIGFLSTGFAHLMYNLALENLEAEIASIISLVVGPLLSIGLAVLILSEGVSIQTIVGGGILVLSGIYLQTHIKRVSTT